jgi:hypothetical protein
MSLTVSDFIKRDRRGMRALRWETFNSIAFDKPLWKAILEQEEVEIDLGKIDFFAHDGVMWVCFVCLARARQGLFTYIALPTDTNAVEYIRYVGLDRLQRALSFAFTNEYLLRASVGKYLSSRTPPYSPVMLQLVTEDRWPHVNGQAYDHIAKFFTERLGISPLGQEFYEGVKPFAGTLQELIHNIVLHAGDEEATGVGLVVHTPPPKAYSTMRFCCTDAGPGFRRTLAERHHCALKSDQDAIVEALLHRFFHKQEGIAGLYGALDYIYARSGHIGIRTGAVFALLDLSSQRTRSQFQSGYRDPNRVWLKSLLRFTQCVPIPGTHIFVDLQLPER